MHHAHSIMTRPAFTLSDDQARQLQQQLTPILERHPAGGRDHRPFVREFVRAVYAATGRSFSPVIYRRLLDVYAPGRTPSTNTLDQEKKALLTELGQEARTGGTLDAATAGADLAAVVQRSVHTALDRLAPTHSPDRSSDQMALAQSDFLQARLTECEAALNQVRSLAARQTAELQAAQAVREALQVQLDAANALALQQSARIEQLTTEVTGMRKFALTAIEAARGETRAQQDRAAHLEGLLKAEKFNTEVFRRLAYRSGAPIPPNLVPEPKS